MYGSGCTGTAPKVIVSLASELCIDDQSNNPVSLVACNSKQTGFDLVKTTSQVHTDIKLRSINNPTKCLHFDGTSTVSMADCGSATAWQTSH